MLLAVSFVQNSGNNALKKSASMEIQKKLLELKEQVENNYKT
jgi:hypothetical protein